MMPEKDKFSPELAKAIQNEVKTAMNDWARESLFTHENMEVFWDTAFKIMHKKAKEQTGGFIFASLSTIIGKIALFLLLGSLVYTYGGWSALVGTFKVWFTSGNT